MKSKSIDCKSLTTIYSLHSYDYGSISNYKLINALKIAMQARVGHIYQRILALAASTEEELLEWTCQKCQDSELCYYI